MVTARITRIAGLAAKKSHTKTLAALVKQNSGTRALPQMKNLYGAKNSYQAIRANMVTARNAALAAKVAHAKALAALIACHGGTRTLSLMKDLLSAIRALHPTTKAIITGRSGMGNVSFPGKGVGFQTWRDMIMPHLPKMRAPTSGGKKQNTLMLELAVKRVKVMRFLPHLCPVTACTPLLETEARTDQGRCRCQCSDAGDGMRYDDSIEDLEL